MQLSIKTLFKRGQVEQEVTGATTSRNYGAPGNNNDLMPVSPIDRYQNDPVRTTSLPDTVGNFFDPMGGSNRPAFGTDVTDTGA
ncbi:hypothetical protein BDF20DRAFT_866716 [Mycotypha africana]|uniref:uncharacterized protein n=1 Tax=Mycotypha africana TaxID=64632 RepID=UPI002300F9EF|nr:uncharacterized protein BDF20DRAFT_866716 [Mycotypha africana]KAI8982398.1 hypothetical protein BDF20DRAFT_866716 [Mycotypha africana]